MATTIKATFRKETQSYVYLIIKTVYGPHTLLKIPVAIYQLVNKKVAVLRWEFLQLGLPPFDTHRSHVSFLCTVIQLLYQLLQIRYKTSVMSHLWIALILKPSTSWAGISIQSLSFSSEICPISLELHKKHAYLFSRQLPKTISHHPYYKDELEHCSPAATLKPLHFSHIYWLQRSSHNLFSQLFSIIYFNIILYISFIY